MSERFFCESFFETTWHHLPSLATARRQIRCRDYRCGWFGENHMWYKAVSEHFACPRCLMEYRPWSGWCDKKNKHPAFPAQKVVTLVSAPIGDTISEPIVRSPIVLGSDFSIVRFGTGHNSDRTPIARSDRTFWKIVRI